MNNIAFGSGSFFWKSLNLEKLTTKFVASSWGRVSKYWGFGVYKFIIDYEKRIVHFCYQNR